MFCPNGISGNIAANGTSQRVDISTADPETGALRIACAVNDRVGFAFGDSTVVAVLASDFHLTTFPEVFKIPEGVTHFAVISDGTTDNVGYAVGQRV